MVLYGVCEKCGGTDFKIKRHEVGIGLPWIECSNPKCKKLVPTSADMKYIDDFEAQKKDEQHTVSDVGKIN